MASVRARQEIEEKKANHLLSMIGPESERNAAKYESAIAKLMATISTDGNGAFKPQASIWYLPGSELREGEHIGPHERGQGGPVSWCSREGLGWVGKERKGGGGR